MVLHKHEYLTNMAVHLLPTLIMTHIRWTVIPAMAHLPAEEQTFFSNLQTDFTSYG
jgi:hypothetical protein